MLTLSLLLVAVTPNDSFAQKNDKKFTKKTSNKKVKVVTPVKQYSKQPRRGAQVTSLPKKTTVIVHSNQSYHYKNGIYYRPVNGSYVVTAPPRGIRVTTLPPNPYRIMVLGQPYYYYYGTYYVSSVQGGYEVVQAPLGARIDALPDGYEVFELDGYVYYKLNDTYYKAVVESDGSVVYEVVRV